METEFLMISLITSASIIVVLFVVAMLVLRGAVSGYDDEEIGREDTMIQQPLPLPGAARLRLVSVARVDDVVIIDGLVDEVGRGVSGPVGMPVTLEMLSPDMFWLDLSIERLLALWASDNRVIEFELCGHPSGAVARFASGGSVVSLPLVTT